MDANKNFKKIKSLVSAFELNNVLNDPTAKLSLKIFDCTYPSIKGHKVYKQLRIKDAKYLSLEKFRSNEILNSENLSLGFPSKQQIFDFLNENKIKKTDMIVLYDQYGIYSSPRAWFILKSFSIKNINLLDGGLPMWMKSKFPIDDEFKNENSSDEEEKIEGIFY
jgi:thiosulfate/3-mercaptopyruvate sulfurtransferase